MSESPEHSGADSIGALLRSLDLRPRQERAALRPVVALTLLLAFALSATVASGATAQVRPSKAQIVVPFAAGLTSANPAAASQRAIERRLERSGARESSEDFRWQRVGRREIVEAMRRQIGYDPTVTTNAARFQAEVLLDLARQARARDPAGPPLFLGHEVWFESFLAATGTTAETAPTHALMGYKHKQDTGVEYRAERVVHHVVEGRSPELALSVLIWWQRAPGTPDSYTYVDSMSSPRLSVTNSSVKTYQLLDYGDMIAFDEIEGLTGRPTSGALGLLFRVMGEGSVKWSRMAFAHDGVMVVRAHATKGPFSVTNTATVYPDGRSEKGVPDRPDLWALDERLSEPLELEYVPLPWFHWSGGRR